MIKSDPSPENLAAILDKSDSYRWRDFYSAISKAFPDNATAQAARLPFGCIITDEPTMLYGEEAYGKGRVFLQKSGLDDEASRLVLDVAKDVAEFSTHPAVRARLTHWILVNSTNSGRGTHIRVAAQSYLEVAKLPTWDTRETAISLSWAMALAKWAGLSEIRAEATGLAFEYANGLVEAKEVKSGLFFPAMRSLLDFGSTDSLVDGLNTLLVAARVLYMNPHDLGKVSELRVALAGKDAAVKLAVRREEIEDYLRMASELSGGYMAQHILTTAASKAEEYGLSELRNKALVDYQRIDPETLPHGEVRTDYKLSDSYISALLEPYETAPTLLAGMQQLIRNCPTGPAPDLDLFSVDNYGLLGRVSLVRIGADGVAHWSPPDNDPDPELTKMYHRWWFHKGNISCQRHLREALYGYMVLMNKFHLTLEECKNEFAVLPNVSEDVAWLLARSWCQFVAGEFDAAFFMIQGVPERLTREALLALDRATLKPSGDYSMLGANTAKLVEVGMPPEWYAFLRAVLWGPEGWKLRNETSHGIRVSAGIYEYLAVLAACLFLGLLQPAPEE